MSLFSVSADRDTSSGQEGPTATIPTLPGHRRRSKALGLAFVRGITGCFNRTGSAFTAAVLRFLPPFVKSSHKICDCYCYNHDDQKVAHIILRRPAVYHSMMLP